MRFCDRYVEKRDRPPYGDKRTTYNARRSLELLRLGSGQSDATFRDGQEEAIRHIVEGRGRLLVVQKTGWGKSFVYFIATKLLREADSGPSLLISPLLALMRNQIAAAERMGVRAVTINSDNQEEWDRVEASIRRNDVDILLISPERLANERFRTEVLADIAARIALLVIDEAHCISDWGHDFRPHYRLLERIVRTLPANLRLLATTATANNRVMDDLKAVLGPNITVSRGDLNRPSLLLQTIRLPSQAERLAWLAAQVPSLPGHGIIYTLTVRDAVQVADWLRSQGFPAEHQAREGKVLCVWGDAGWGELVRRGKYEDRRFSDDLVAACVKLVRDWVPQPAPQWVTCIPSRRHPELVPDFARRLATALNLRFYAVLEKTDDRPEQKTMANSTQQARNIDGSLAIVSGTLPHGPVLLVDDMVDSRWTLTVAAWLLRKHGSGDVFPLALSRTGRGD